MISKISAKNNNKEGYEIDYTSFKVPIIPNKPPRFDIETESEDMIKYLQENGYAIVKNAANEREIYHAKELFWKWALTLSENLNRNDLSTWNNKNWPGNEDNGICHFINHSEFCWFSRLLPNVKKSFSNIWKTNDLIVSFDAGNVFRPWKYNREWITSGNWWHVDQNALTGKHKDGLISVQGFVNYYKADENTGGLCVIPKSHLDHINVCKRASASQLKIDFISLSPKEEPLLRNNNGILVCAEAGDLVLWDSRTIHCNTPSLNYNDDINNNSIEKNNYNLNLEKKRNYSIKNETSIKEEYNNNNENISYNFDNQDNNYKIVNNSENDVNDIIRLVSYVCMVPYSHASENVIEKKKLGFINKKPTSHWPTEEIKTYLSTDEDNPFEIDKCNKEMLELAGFKKNKSFCDIF